MLHIKNKVYILVSTQLSGFAAWLTVYFDNMNKNFKSLNKYYSLHIALTKALSLAVVLLVKQARHAVHVDTWLLQERYILNYRRCTIKLNLLVVPTFWYHCFLETVSF